MAAALFLALVVVLAGCCQTPWYDPAKDPTHIERCDSGEEAVEFCP